MSYFEKESIGFDNFDTCPEDYKKIVIRILALQAYAERLGAIEVSGKLSLAPDFRARRQVSQIAHEESIHACLLYGILEKVGVSENEALTIAMGSNLDTPSSKSLEGPMAVGDDDNQWIDIALNAMLLDRAGCYMVNNFAQSSFKPWANACQRIYKDELFHKSFGLAQFKKHISQPHDESELINKFMTWYSRGLNFFGPPNVKSTDRLKEYGIKREDNETMRLKYIEEVAAMMRDLNLSHFIKPLKVDAYPFRFEAS
ncbi:MAG: phenylacetate-CoA oxygenase subunit PaaI [Pseudobacteriovorax sp.]|nr:phenylacetate-CoA oxygenase subunit PaaI [Pseudobacteriovorax sp.]